MPDLAPKLLPLLRAHHLWFHGAHHAASGPAFVGDHALYGDAYAAFDGWFDEAAELLVPVEGIGITDPAKLEPAVFAVLSTLPKTAALAADALAKAALDRVVTAEAEVVAAVKALDAMRRSSCATPRRKSSTAMSPSYKLGRRVA